MTVTVHHRLLVFVGNVLILVTRQNRAVLTLNVEFWTLFLLEQWFVYVYLDTKETLLCNATNVS